MSLRKQKENTTDTTIITRKISLSIVGDNKKESWEKIRYINNTLYKLANNLMSYLFVHEKMGTILMDSSHTPSDIKKLTASEKKNLKKQYDDKIKELFNESSIKSSAYRFVANNSEEINSSILAGLSIDVLEVYKKHAVDIFIGKSSLPSFKKGMPITTIKNKLKFNNQYEFSWYDKVQMKLFFGRDRSNNKEIVDRCIKGDYEICDSYIQYKDNGLYLLLRVRIPKQSLILDPEISVGVDLGLSKAVYCAINKGLKRLSIDNTILKPRLKIQAQRRTAFKAMKFATGGRGRNSKMKYEKLIGAERNVVKTLNHKISKQVIQFAIKNNAHKIYLEDLKGFNTSEFVLKNWSYYELQTMIQQKATKYGIVVQVISPTYTSQVCNSCGCKGERKNQSTFICHNKECNVNEVDADYNAAKNIANGGVGLIYNQEVKSLFESLDYGQVVLPEVEEKRFSLIHSTSTFNFLLEKYGVKTSLLESYKEYPKNT